MSAYLPKVGEEILPPKRRITFLALVENMKE
jgi:hypothetical protein